MTTNTNTGAKLPLGCTDFETIRKAGAPYVDKTALLYQLANPSFKFFFARPRGFGKSLLVSTLASLFEHGLEYFKGLAIESLWTDKRTYRVIRLDFSELTNFRTREEFDELFERHLVERFGHAGFRRDERGDNTSWLVLELGSWLDTLPIASCVLLIDDCDAPLLAASHDPELFEGIAGAINSFYAMVKSKDAPWRLIFRTGTFKCFRGSLFASSCNNMLDVTLNTELAPLLGFTAEEIRQTYPAELARAAECTGLTMDGLLEALERHYGGYCFDGSASREEAAPRLLRPDSVLRFLENPEKGFVNCELLQADGSPRSFSPCIAQLTPPEPEADGKLDIDSSEITALIGFDTMNAKARLLQAGLLTIEAEWYNWLLVRCPNEDAKEALERLRAENSAASQAAKP